MWDVGETVKPSARGVLDFPLFTELMDRCILHVGNGTKSWNRRRLVWWIPYCEVAIMRYREMPFRTQP